MTSRGLLATAPCVQRKSSFPPVAAGDARVLIVGSLPGEASLAAGRYYAHPRNQFWLLAGAAIGQPIAELAYEQRLQALREAGVALWDVVASAERRGSLDAALRDVARNRLGELVAALPLLRAVAFNGGTAARIGRALLAGAAVALVDLPSSSPAYTAPFAAKLERWTSLRDFLC